MKRITILLTVLALMLVGVMAVGAQDDTGADDPELSDTLFANRGILDMVMEITGLTAEDIQAGIDEGQTLAELIEANGGDVEAVTEELLALGLENYELRLSERLDTLMSHELGSRLPYNGRGLNIAQEVLDITGLTVADIRQGYAEGMTLAEVIEANGGDVETVTEALIAAAVEQFPNADEETIAARIDTLLNHELGSGMPEGRPGFGNRRSGRSENMGPGRGFGGGLGDLFGPFGAPDTDSETVPATPETEATDANA